MLEKLHHKQAFEIYYQMGKDRSLRKLQATLSHTEGIRKTYNLTTLQKWNENFHWQDRIRERDQRIGEKLAKQTEDDVLKAKLKYRNQLNVFNQAIIKTLEKVIIKDKDGNIVAVNTDAKTTRDLTDLVKSHQSIIQTDMGLLGEASNTQRVIVIEGKDAQNLEKILASINEKKEEKDENEK